MMTHLLLVVSRDRMRWHSDDDTCIHQHGDTEACNSCVSTLNDAAQLAMRNGTFGPTSGVSSTEGLRADDPVLHPSHYTWLPGVECWKVAQHFNFNLGNVIKYVWRAGRKRRDSELTDMLEDLEKGAQYLDHEINRVTTLLQENLR